MSEDTPETEGEDSDVEAEMLRMMQEEVGEGEAEEPASEGGGGEDADQLLEAEMQRAMQMEEEDSGGGLMAFGGGGACQRSINRQKESIGCQTSMLP